jgi:CBS domain containing-hemolysin-like protein
VPLVVGETDTIEHCEEMLATDHDSYPVIASRPDNMQVVGLMRRAAMIKALKIAKSREDRTVNFGRMMELCPWMVPDTMPANRAYKVRPESPAKR